MALQTKLDKTVWLQMLLFHFLLYLNKFKNFSKSLVQMYLKTVVQTQQGVFIFYYDSTHLLIQKLQLIKCLLQNRLHELYLIFGDLKWRKGPKKCQSGWRSWRTREKDVLRLAWDTKPELARPAWLANQNALVQLLSLVRTPLFCATRFQNASNLFRK